MRSLQLGISMLALSLLLAFKVMVGTTGYSYIYLGSKLQDLCETRRHHMYRLGRRLGFWVPLYYNIPHEPTDR